MVVSCHVSLCLVTGLQVFYAFTYWGECFRPVIRVYSNSCILIFYFSTYVLYLNMRYRNVWR